MTQMKSIKRIFGNFHRVKASLWLIALTAATIFSIIACIDNQSDAPGNKNNIDVKDGPVHYTGTLSFSGQQVCKHNNAANLSNMYYEFKGNREISVNVIMRSETNPEVFSMVSAGSGKIENGIMDFSINEPEPEKLMEWVDLKLMFPFWKDVNISIEETKGNLIELITSDNKWLNKERLIGTGSSLGMESIMFFYVDTDCQITGGNDEGYFENGYYFTENELALSLKKGWNTISQKEIYTQSGRSVISMEVRHPDSNWVIYY